jgi:hypothetical protein
MGGVSYVPPGEGGGTGTPAPVLLEGKDAYAVNNIEDLDPVLYVGKTRPDGAWLVIQYNDTTGVMGYAAVNTNPAVTTYAAAWSGRSGLTYGVFDSVDL